MQEKKMQPDNSPAGHHAGRKGGRQARDGQEPEHERRQHGQGHAGGGRDRARRGEARFILLDALRDSPKHGYEIIKTLEERSAGQYVPSPGTVYPTLQYLEDQGLVRGEQQAERRIYQLTAAGQSELEAQTEQLTVFWARLAATGVAEASRHEVNFLEDQLNDLTRTVWRGLREAIERGDQVTIRSVRQVVEACQNQIREIISTIH